MPPISFRAWHKETRTMARVLELLETRITVSPCIDLERQSSYYKDSPKCVHPGICTRPSSEFILMQSTGLKDKNGLEIFEGDILELTATNPVHRVKVEWGGEFEVCGFVLTGIQPFANGFVEHSHDQLNKRWEDGFTEVIGNVHEYPELLSPPSP